MPVHPWKVPGDVLELVYDIKSRFHHPRLEGAEIVALRGARALLAGPKPPRLVFMEVHPKFLPSYNATAEEVIGLLSSTGYRTLSAGTVHDQIHVVATREKP